MEGGTLVVHGQVSDGVLSQWIRLPLFFNRKWLKHVAKDVLIIKISPYAQKASLSTLLI